MSRWKALPDELDPRVRQLVVHLRRLKDHSGLSLRQLSVKTGYSASSWERYLSGRSLPPRDAVEAMARISGDDPTRLLALHEVATDAWEEGRAGSSAPHANARTRTTSRPGPDGDRAGGPDDETRHWRSLRVALVAGSVALVLALSSAILLVVRLSDGESRASTTPAGSSAATASVSTSPSEPAPRTYPCEMQRIDGLWYAGNSRTDVTILTEGLAGPDVAEAQCLLRRAGFSPGAIDGIYGPHTKRAVEQLQKQADLVVDGTIGKHTWGVLRR